MCIKSSGIIEKPRSTALYSIAFREKIVIKIATTVKRPKNRLTFIFKFVPNNAIVVTR